MPAILRVNGIAREIHAPSTAPLSTVLGDELGLWAARVGCARGQCGSCVVLVDGRATPSCTLPLADAVGHEVITLEGLAQEPGLHPLQEAFVAEDALQCGFCTSGLLLAAAALLRDNSAPTDEDIRAALDNHLCRCGVHLRVIRAVQRAARSLRR